MSGKRLFSILNDEEYCTESIEEDIDDPLNSNIIKIINNQQIADLLINSIKCMHQYFFSIFCIYFYFKNRA